MKSNDCQVSHKSSIMLSTDGHRLWKRKCLLMQEFVKCKIMNRLIYK